MRAIRGQLQRSDEDRVQRARIFAIVSVYRRLDAEGQKLIDLALECAQSQVADRRAEAAQ